MALAAHLYFENQIEAGEQFITVFTTTYVRAGLLRADVQSGKTGTYHYIIQQMFIRGLIDQAYIICGSHELELLEQCCNDVLSFHTNHQYYTANPNCIQVIFRQHFKATIQTARTLIIVDETHLVEEKNQTLSKFLKRHNLTMAGTEHHMILNNTYIISVDATPHAEESALIYNESLPKCRVILKNGPSYFGPQHYYREQRIKPTFNLSQLENKNRFKAIIQRATRKFVLVRVQTKRNKQYKYLMECLQELDCNIVHFTSEYKEATTEFALSKQDADNHMDQHGSYIPCLEVEPEKTTIVLIDGRLRCGKRISKMHIGCVWVMSNNAKTDTIIQGLLGRMCGYDVPEQKIDIYIPERLLKKDENKIVSYSDLQRYFMGTTLCDDNNMPLITPRFASNIIPGTIKNKAIKQNQEMTQCPPIRFILDPLQIERLAGATRAEIQVWCFNNIVDNKEQLIQQNTTLSIEQKHEIDTWLNTHRAEDCHIRNLTGTSHRSYHTAVINAYNTHTCPNEHISDYHFITCCVTYRDCQPESSIQRNMIIGAVYTTFYTVARGFIKSMNKNSRISKHNGKTHFSVHLSSELALCPAVSGYGFSQQIREDPAIFERELEYFIHCGNSGIGVFGKRFTSLHSGEHILLPRRTYGNRLEHFNEIVERFRTRGIIISYRVKRYMPRVYVEGIIPRDHELAFIEWNNM